MTTLICDCNQTMPLNAKALGEALHENLTLHSTLCRRDAGAFQRAIQSGETVVVACTQEQRLFADLGQQTEGALSPIRFVNIREMGGWSRDAGKASPKIAALLAAAHLPEPAPVPTVTFKSAGRLLIIGALDAAEQAAALVADVLDVTLFTQGPGNAGGAQARRFPVLVLTARGAVGDKVAGLNAGADDYLSKPFDLEELDARIRALLRRKGGADASSQKCGDLRYERHSGAFYLGDDPLELTPREQALLEMLINNQGRAVKKDRLLQQVFPADKDAQLEAVEVLVYRLRKKIADTRAEIVTLRGLGYLLRAQRDPVKA